MGQIIWREKMAIGCREIDDDHKNLIANINRLELALTARRFEPTPVHEVLEAFETYAVDHFRREERLMTAIRFPLLKEHRLAHTAFVAKLTILRRAFDAVPVPANAWDVYRFITQWLIRHIVIDDHEIATYLPRPPRRP